ncbi:hypothetical protein QA447_30540 [Pseudomonas sp. abacavir_1]
MKVKDLIEQLAKLDPELQLVGYSEDAEVLEKDQLVRLFDVSGVTAENCNLSRDENRKLRIELQGDIPGRSVALLELTTDL